MRKVKVTFITNNELNNCTLEIDGHNWPNDLMSKLNQFGCYDIRSIQSIIFEPIYK